MPAWCVLARHAMIHPGNGTAGTVKKKGKVNLLELVCEKQFCVSHFISICKIGVLYNIPGHTLAIIQWIISYCGEFPSFSLVQVMMLQWTSLRNYWVKKCILCKALLHQTVPQKVNISFHSFSESCCFIVFLLPISNSFIPPVLCSFGMDR